MCTSPTAGLPPDIYDLKWSSNTAKSEWSRTKGKAGKTLGIQHTGLTTKDVKVIVAAWKAMPSDKLAMVCFLRHLNQENWVLIAVLTCALGYKSPSSRAWGWHWPQSSVTGLFCGCPSCRASHWYTPAARPCQGPPCERASRQFDLLVLSWRLLPSAALQGREAAETTGPVMIDGSEAYWSMLHAVLPALYTTKKEPWRRSLLHLTRKRELNCTSMAPVCGPSTNAMASPMSKS